MNTNTNRIKQWQEQEALSRFQLIAPLLQEDLDDAKRLQLRKQIAQDNDISVRSIYRYEKAYREGQFAGLFFQTFLQTAPYDAGTGGYQVRSEISDREKWRQSTDVSFLRNR